MKDCVFCKIVKGEIPAEKVWESKDFLAFLDIKPKVEGMTVLISKQHFDAHVFNLPEDKYGGFFEAAREVAVLLEQKLKADRIFLVKEGAEVDHAHLKIYPVKGDFLLREVMERKAPRSPEVLTRVGEKIRS